MSFTQEYLKEVVSKLSKIDDGIKFLYPYTTLNSGSYETGKNHPFAWTCGFYGGILWYLYLKTKDKKFLEKAKRCSLRMEEGLTEYSILGHDVGFQFLFTNVADFKITGDENAKKRALHAANLLAGRYNPKGQFIRAWNECEGVNPEDSKAGYAIIDCMMNLPLLYWASEVTNDPHYKQIAMLHADTAIQQFIREDGSANHIVVFNPETGEVVKKPEGQGYSEGSSWTRGQAWALYGFAMSYHYTKEARYLDAAIKVSEYIMKSFNGEYMPIDFVQPKEPKYLDSSAAAICTCGFLELMKYVSAEEKEKYADIKDKLIKILYENSNFELTEQSIVQNCSEMYHRESSRHISLIYADFYLLEALMRLDGFDILFY